MITAYSGTILPFWYPLIIYMSVKVLTPLQWLRIKNSQSLRLASLVYLYAKSVINHVRVCQGLTGCIKDELAGHELPTSMDILIY